MKHIVTFLLSCTLITLTPKTSATNDWATQTLQGLTLDQKIGQLFMVAAHTDESINKLHTLRSPYIMHKKHIEKLIKEYHIGGIIYLGASTAEKQLQRTTHYQKLSDIPLLVGQDCEWGFAMRSKEATKFPYALTLGAITNNNLIYECGKAIGEQCKIVGVHINFAPVCDINSHPDNPIIGYRSFGADKDNVAQKALVFTQGLQDAGILACAKHFPGHGNTNQDSHLMLPVIHNNKETIINRELYPFKQLINNNVAAVMTAHLAIPALDHTNTPASCSHKVVTNLLRKKLNFNGLIITDGLGMRGITKKYKNGDAELNAFLAGNDILLCPVEVAQAHKKIKQVVIEKNLYEKLNEHVLRILQTKEQIFIKQDCQLPRTIDQRGFDNDNLLQKLFDNAITVLNDKKILLHKDQRVKHVNFGNNPNQLFIDKLQKICTLTENDYETLIITLHPPSHHPHNNFGIKPKMINKIKSLSRNNNTILIIFGSPYLAKQFNTTTAKTIVAYENNHFSCNAALKLLQGQISAQGILSI